MTIIDLINVIEMWCSPELATSMRRSVIALLDDGHDATEICIVQMDLYKYIITLRKYIHT